MEPVTVQGTLYHDEEADARLLKTRFGTLLLDKEHRVRRPIAPEAGATYNTNPETEVGTTSVDVYNVGDPFTLYYRRPLNASAVHDLQEDTTLAIDFDNAAAVFDTYPIDDRGAVRIVDVTETTLDGDSGKKLRRLSEGRNCYNDDGEPTHNLTATPTFTLERIGHAPRNRVLITASTLRTLARNDAVCRLRPFVED